MQSVAATGLWWTGTPTSYPEVREMKNITSSLCIALLAWGFLALTADAQQIQGTGTLLRGQVVSVGNGQFVLRGPNNQTQTFYTNPRPRYYSGSQAAQWNSI